MVIAHLAVISPKRCGLYETMRELVSAERALGHDARIVDPVKEQVGEDRGVPFASYDWADSADVLMSHSGLADRFEGDCEIPVIHVAHGRPRSTFLTELGGGPPIYSYWYHKNRDERFRAVVTFWKEHVPYLEAIWSDTPVHFVPASVDLEAWTPDGPKGYGFRGLAGKTNIVCTDVWRADIDPFLCVNAMILYCRKHPGTRFHMYGTDKNKKGWSAMMKTLQNEGGLGEVLPWVHGLANVFRAADATISPHTIATRSVRESMACGCPVAKGCTGPVELCDRLEEVLTHDRSDVRRQAEQLFDLAQTGRAMVSVIEEHAMVGVT